MEDLIPIIISLGSLLIAAIALGWNIYRDVIHKARLKIHFGVMVLFQGGKRIGSSFIETRITNLGPGQIVINNLVVYEYTLVSFITRKYNKAIINPDFTHPSNTRIPFKLDIAESGSIVIPYARECILSEKRIKLGVADSFGRIHWISRHQIKAARRTYKREYIENANEQC